MTGMPDYVVPPPPPNPYMVSTPPRQTYASWIQRVAAYLLDLIFALPGLVPLFIAFRILATDQQMIVSRGNEITIEPTRHAWATGGPWLAVGLVLTVAIWVWNRLIRQGRTGYSWGKSIVGIQLVKDETGYPTGAWWSLLRELVHSVNSALFGLGWFWPLWDRKRQTWSDMITRTVVIKTPRP